MSKGLFTAWTVKENRDIRIQLRLDADFKDTDKIRELYHKADKILCELLKLNRDAKVEENQNIRKLKHLYKADSEILTSALTPGKLRKYTLEEHKALHESEGEKND